MLRGAPDHEQLSPTKEARHPAGAGPGAPGRPGDAAGRTAPRRPRQRAAFRGQDRRLVRAARPAPPGAGPAAARRPARAGPTARDVAQPARRRSGRDEAPVALILAGRLSDWARASGALGSGCRVPRSAERAGARQRLAGRRAGPRGGRRPGRRAAGVWPGSRRARRAPAHPGQLRAARPGHRARPRAGDARAAARAPPMRAPCCAGASGGGRPRWPSRRSRPTARCRRELAALRDNGRRLAQARAEGEPTEQLETERARLERAVRAEHHRRAGRSRRGRRRGSTSTAWWPRSGAGTLVELVHVDGTLHVLVVHDGRVRRRVAGATDEALVLADHGRSAMRRAAHGRPYAPGDLGARLQETLLGPAADLLPDGPVTLVPTGRLHARPGRCSRRWPTGRSTWCRQPVSGCGPARSGHRPTAKVLLLAAPGSAAAGPRCRCWPGVTRARRCSTGSTPRSSGRWPGSTARPWPTSRRTAASAPTARCSPRSRWPTGR